MKNLKNEKEKIELFERANKMIFELGKKIEFNLKEIERLKELNENFTKSFEIENNSGCN